MENFRQFVGFLMAAAFLGTFSVVFVLIWVFYWRGGLAWDQGFLEFNWHPVLSTIGFIFINGFGLIIYRLPWTWNISKPLMKYVHAGLNFIVFVLMVISLVAVFDFHNAKKIPNMYSLHSWVGLAAVIMHAVQAIIGICIFLMPFTPMFIKTFYMSIHVFTGLLVFGMSITAAEMGITEKLIFSLRPGSNSTLPYSQSPPEAILVNTLGIFILLFGGCILWIAKQPEWKRPSQHTKENIGNEERSILNKATDVSPEIKNECAHERGELTHLNLEDVGQRSTF
ncbi:plasma membrane ascorbate-dependent reductase CYBRD1 [Stegostoma tigrinum]|uniref:plasma membrane ascorbate-dependent reductase CYBRD1 n=1 Tax=Stegostoma tigrinum TaxID=3053191 RepID=UPI00286FD110|nr:plasma membrane ascorbate-dependent reductase CYBRD1 [Stegostoma tigrinum]